MSRYRQVNNFPQTGLVGRGKNPKRLFTGDISSVGPPPDPLVPLSSDS
ncbi:hypothetical protein JNB11_05260 [Kocuria palustris]|nr:hypothetical protein [Kocuria palustris]